MQLSNYTRNYVIMKTYGRCGYCGKPLIEEEQATFDHIIPVNSKGTANKDNILLCCFDCNQDKGSLTLEDFRDKRQNKLMKFLKRSGLPFKAVGTVQFFFERLQSSGVKAKIEEMLDNV